MVNKLAKKWKYGQFDVEAYTCGDFDMKFREYKTNGKHSFTLKLQKGRVSEKPRAQEELQA